MLKKDNRKEVLIQNLKDAGCDLKTIDEFIKCWNGGQIEDINKLLRSYRASLLSSIHKKQKEIDILDYLLLDLEKKKTAI